MKGSEFMEFRSLCGWRIADVWEKDELVIQAVEAEKGLPNVEILEDL